MMRSFFFQDKMFNKYYQSGVFLSAHQKNISEDFHQLVFSYSIKYKECMNR